MVLLATLKFLAAQKIKYANILLRNKRNNAAIYMMGYAIELSLKRKLSFTLGFNEGFPENKRELHLYSKQIAVFNSVTTEVTLTNITDIRNHNLTVLLNYSGAQAKITKSVSAEWLIVKNWNREQRYLRLRVSKKKAREFIRAARKVLTQIL